MISEHFELQFIFDITLEDYTSSNIIVTLTEETNRLSHSDTKKLDHFITCNIIV